MIRGLGISCDGTTFANKVALGSIALTQLVGI